MSDQSAKPATTSNNPAPQQSAAAPAPASSAAPVNAWSKKLAFKGPTSAENLKDAQPQKSGPVLISGQPPAGAVMPQSSVQITFGSKDKDSGNQAPNGTAAAPTPVKTTLSYASVTGKVGANNPLTPPNSSGKAPLVSGNVPKDVQLNIAAGKPGSAGTVSFGTLSTQPIASPVGDKKPAAVALSNSSNVQHPLPTTPGGSVNPAFKQFEEIQRTRSAPPQLSEQEKLQLALKQQNQIQSAQQKSPAPQQPQQPAHQPQQYQPRPSHQSSDRGRSRTNSTQHQQPHPSLNPAASSFAPQQFFPARPMGYAMAPPPHGYFIPYPAAYGMYPAQGFIPPQGFRPPAGAVPPMLPNGAPAMIAVPVPPGGVARPPSNVQANGPANNNNTNNHGPAPAAPSTPSKQPAADGSKKSSPSHAAAAALPAPTTPAAIPVMVPGTVPAMPPAVTPQAPQSKPSVVPGSTTVPPVVAGGAPSGAPVPTKPIILPKRERKVIVFTNPETGEAIKLPEKEKEPKKEASVTEKEADKKEADKKEADKPVDDAVKKPAETDVAKQKAPEAVAEITAVEQKSPPKKAKETPAAVASPSKEPKPVTTVPSASSAPAAKKEEPKATQEKPKEKPSAAGKTVTKETSKPVSPVPVWPAKMASPPKAASPAASTPPQKVSSVPVTAPAAPASKTTVTAKAAAPAAAPATTAPTKKLTYSRDFLLKFRELCIERPPGMPSVEALVGEEAGANNRRRSGVQPPPRSRHSDVGLPSSRPSSRGGPPRSNGGGNQKYPPGMPSGGRQSMGPRKPSGAGPRRSQPQHPEPPKEYVAPLVKTENRWVPGAKEDDPSVALVRQTRSLLNKLTLEKFDSISKKMIALEILNDDMLRELIATIFEKAVDEPKFAEMYARLCYTLASSLPNYPKEYVDMMVASSKDGQTEQNFEMRHQFRRSLLLKCQGEFQSKTEWSKIADDDIKITDSMSDEQLAEIAAEKSRRQKLKRRALGNIKFIGELFKLGVLTEKIMHHCLKALLANVEDPEEEAIESVCDLMEIVGEKLDHAAARSLMDQYFDRLKTLEQNESLPSRVRFKIKDVLELRSRNWRERERQKMLNAGPMTIEEVHQAAAAQERAEQKKMERLSRGGRRSDDRRSSRGGRGSEGGRPSMILKRTESRNNAPLPPRHLEKSGSTDSVGRKGRDDRSGRATPANAPSRSSSIDSRTEKRSISRKNMFDALVADGDADREEGEVVSDEEEEIIDSPAEFAIADLEKQVKTEKEFNDYFAKEFKSEFFTAVEDSYTEAIKVILVLRSYVADDKMTATTISAIEKLITDIAPETRKDSKSSKKRVDGFANVFAQLFASDLLTKEDFDTFMENQLINMSDMILDIPGLDAMLGHICAACILSKLMDLEFVKTCILKMAEDLGDFTPRMPTRPGMRGPSPPAVAEFFGTLLASIRDAEGTSVLQELWLAFIQQQEEYSNDTALEKLDAQAIKYPWFGTDREKLALIPDSIIAEWLIKYDLLSSVAPKLQIASEIAKALQAPTTAEDLKKFLESSFDASIRQSSAFIEALTAALLRHVQAVKEMAGQPQPAKEEDLFKSWLGSTLKELIDAAPLNQRPALQLQVLFAAQQAGNTEPLKKNDDQYFRRLFESLYESDVIEEQTFLKWEEGNEQQLETKGLTMARGAKEFLQWLKTA